MSYQSFQRNHKPQAFRTFFNNLQVISAPNLCHSLEHICFPIQQTTIQLLLIYTYFSASLSFYR